MRILSWIRNETKKNRLTQNRSEELLSRETLEIHESIFYCDRLKKSPPIENVRREQKKLDETTS